MNRVQPFRGWRYDLQKAGAASLNELVTPPYDVINDQQQAAFYARNPHNVIRIDLARDHPGDDDRTNRYSRAAGTLTRWQASGILRQEPEPAMYLLRERYPTADGDHGVRTGLIFRLKLAPWGEGILPHERTFPGAKADRLALTIATASQCSPIFLLYSDPSGDAQRPLLAAAERPADVAFQDDDGVEHAVWVLTGSDLLAAAALESKTFYLADGHHRYETALNYQRYRRGGLLPDTPAPAPLSSWQAVPNFAAHPAPGPSETQPYDFAWVYAACMEDPGVLILPTHRCIHDVADFDADRLFAQLERRFEITAVPGDDALLDALRSAAPHEHAFALVLPGYAPGVLLRMRKDSAATALLHAADHPAVAGVDVAVLQTLVLGPLLGISREPDELKRHVSFTPDAEQAIGDARAGRCQAAFLVNPTRLEQLAEVSQEGQVMPPKATYFYPKLPAGLVINCIE